jgi:hypothetical protein
MPAPVWPAVTDRVGFAALDEVDRDDDRRVLLLTEGERGCSSMPMTWLAWTIVTLAGSAPRSTR